MKTRQSISLCITVFMWLCLNSLTRSWISNALPKRFPTSSPTWEADRSCDLAELCHYNPYITQSPYGQFPCSRVLPLPEHPSAAVLALPNSDYVKVIYRINNLEKLYVTTQFVLSMFTLFTMYLFTLEMLLKYYYINVLQSSSSSS